MLGPRQVEPQHAESHEESSNAEFTPLGDIYALGDCSANVEGPLPALAQVMGTCLNEALARKGPQKPAQQSFAAPFQVLLQCWEDLVQWYRPHWT